MDRVAGDANGPGLGLDEQADTAHGVPRQLNDAHTAGELLTLADFLDPVGFDGHPGPARRRPIVLMRRAGVAAFARMDQ